MINQLLGFAIGAIWSAANLFFTVNIFKIGLLKKDPAKLSALILLKFPVLYLAGFLILNTRKFSISSLLAGLMAVVIIAGAMKLWPKRA